MFSKKVGNVYRTQKVGEIHKKADYSWVVWVIIGLVILGAINGG